METWAVLGFGILTLWLLAQILDRLPASKRTAEANEFPVCEEGFEIRCDEFAEGPFEVGYEGEWSAGRYFEVRGNVLPYHEDYQEKQKLKFAGRQMVRFHPSTEPLTRSRIGNVFVRGERWDVHIFLPFEVHQQLLADFRTRVDRILEVDVAESKVKQHKRRPQFGVYRFTVSDPS